MRSKLRYLTIVAALAAAAPPAFGQIIIGTNGGGNCFPLNCGSLTAYQEIYKAGDFGSSPYLISTIGFFTNLEYGPTSYNGEVASLSMGTTTTSVAGIGNIGTNPIANSAVFFSGVVLNGVINDPTFGGTPYLYDPSQGNLILDWTFIPGTYAYENGFMQADYTNNCTDLSRAWNSTVEGNSHSCAGALVTQFNGGTVNVGVTPEPATMALLATGLLGVGIIRRRQAASAFPPL